MNRRVAALAIWSLVLLGAPPGWPQSRTQPSTTAPRTFAVRGTLRHYDTSQAMEMIRVDLKRLTGEVVATSFTRSNGDFEFGGIVNGMYYVVVEERGFEPLREGVEVVNASRAGLFLFLRPVNAPSIAQPGGPMVSARELSLPHDAVEEMHKGMNRLYDKKDAKGSLAHFERAVGKLPSYYEAYYQMGVAHMRMGEAAESEQAYRKSIEVSENGYAPACIDLAALLSNIDRYAEAEGLARRGIELEPKAWQGHFELARALMGLNRVDAAEKSGLEVRTRKPDFPSLYLLLANVHIRKHNDAALLEDLDTFLKLEPIGEMSEKAREMRDVIQRRLAKAQNTPPPEPPKP